MCAGRDRQDLKREQRGSIIFKKRGERYQWLPGSSHCRANWRTCQESQHGESVRQLRDWGKRGRRRGGGGGGRQAGAALGWAGAARRGPGLARGLLGLGLFFQRLPLKRIPFRARAGKRERERKNKNVSPFSNGSYRFLPAWWGAGLGPGSRVSDKGKPAPTAPPEHSDTLN